MNTNQNPLTPETPRRLSDDERERMLLQLIDANRADMARSISDQSEILAMRAAILKLAESQGLDRKGFSDWMDEVKKHFHHKMLSNLEDKDAWIASVLDDRKKDDM
jgi:hypothetical protein